MGTLAQPNFDSIISTTLQEYNSSATSQILNSTVIWYKLKERKRITEWNGGRSIVEPLISAENSTIKMIRDYEAFDLTPQEGITAAEFFAKQMVGSVAISGIEEALNSGKNAVIDLLTTKMTQLDDTFMKRLGQYTFLADGTAADGRGFQGLDVMVENGTSWGVYGTIDRGAADGSGDFWRNGWTATGGTFTALGVATLKTMYNNGQIGNDGLDLFVTSQGIYEVYETLAAAFAKFEMIQPRYDQKLADLGFANLLYKDVPMVYDPYITGLTSDGSTSTGALEILGLNTKYIAFRALSGRNMVLTSFVKPANQDARYASRLFYGNFTCSAPYRQQRSLFTALA